MSSAPPVVPPKSRARPKARRPDLDTVFTINADGSRNFLHPADVHGRFQTLKSLVWAVLLLIYVGLPWLPLGGHPAVQIDLPGRSAHLFGMTFTNQDFYLVFFLVSGLGFALFVATALWGRIWCGYACPQTVFLEGVFRRVERWIEGPRDSRIRRNLGPLTFDKAWRKTLKQGVFLALAWLNAHAFLAYFIPAKELVHAVTGPPSAHMAAFVWGTAWTIVLWFDYAWFREQTCLAICPYGRAQSALIDAETIVIGYDAKRGEPRSKATQEGGDCIDCFRCVAVCPTGIDIRNGLQMECIACANCVDACDEVMARVGRPKGLIRYDSTRGFAGERRRSLARPRVLVYAALGLLGLCVAGFVGGRREPFEVRVLRSRGLPFDIDETTIRNVFDLRVQNKSGRSAVYTLVASPGKEAPPGFEVVIAQPRLELASLADQVTPLIVTLPRAAWSDPFPFTVVVADSASGRSERVELRFRGP
ncbi:MAG: cytochrome c oxidase accessory protein CcoG [bacterium]